MNEANVAGDKQDLIEIERQKEKERATRTVAALLQRLAPASP
jgi:hypothetical protein